MTRAEIAAGITKELDAKLAETAGSWGCRRARGQRPPRMQVRVGRQPEPRRSVRRAMGPGTPTARHDRAVAGAEQHVVEREPLGKSGLNVRHSRHPSSDPRAAQAPSGVWRGCLTWVERSS